MATPFLIVDGYNLMHAAGIARRSYGPGDLRRCRRRLNRQLADLLSTNVAKRTTVVYDAFDSPSASRRHQTFSDLTIRFAPPGRDADSEIEELLRVHSAPRQVVVVSSDHRLHKAASRRKAKCVDSELFWRQIEDNGNSIRRSDLQQAAASTNQVSPEDGCISDDSDLSRWAADIQQQIDEAESTSNEAPFDPDYLSNLSDELNDGRIK